MDDSLKKARIQLCERRCRECGIPFTLQRRAILETILDCDDHPTADQVHDLLNERSAGISRATVYRSLETLARLDVITKACHPGSVVRYDPRVEVHHHLVCKICDAILDIEDEHLNAIPLPDTTAFDFEVHDFRVQLRGVCLQCKKKEES